MIGSVTISDVEAVRRMLAAKVRQVEMARELNLSIWTIEKIVRFWRREEEVVAEGQTLDDDAPPGFEAKNLRRCPECGAMVYLWPCLACRGSLAGAVLVDTEDKEEELEDLFGIGGLESMEF